MPRGRFRPLSRIITEDDFDRGFCGWTQLVGNYEDTLDNMLPGYAQHTSPMLSTVSHWDAGSHGGVDGDYVLKIATRPRTGAQNVTIKRLTFREASRIRMEAYVTFKPEAREIKLSETGVRSLGFLFDLQSGDQHGAAERVMPHLRFLNALGDEHVQRWQFKQANHPFVPVAQGNGGTISHYHLAPEGWEDLPGGEQRLCYNEIATKVNWHYLRFDFDLAAMRCLEFQCNDRHFDMSGFAPMRMPAMRNLWCMLNLAFFVESNANTRSFGYIDSVCLSGDFE